MESNQAECYWSIKCTSQLHWYLLLSFEVKLAFRHPLITSLCFCNIGSPPKLKHNHYAFVVPGNFPIFSQYSFVYDYVMETLNNCLNY